MLDLRDGIRFCVDVCFFCRCLLRFERGFEIMSSLFLVLYLIYSNNSVSY